MRVLHFLPVYAPAWQFGGPVLSVSRLCEGLVENGVDVRVITTNAGLPDIVSEQLGIPIDVNGVEVYYYPVEKHRKSIRSGALVDSLAEHMEWAELLHLSAIWQPLGIPIQKAAYSAGVPIIHTLRGALSPYSLMHGWWKKMPYFLLREKALLQKATTLHCTTRQEEHEVKWLGLKAPIEVIPNPLDLRQLRYDPRCGQVWRQRIGLAQDEPLLLVAGRIHHKKGLDLLPKVLDIVRDQEWQIAFIGKDEDGTGRLLKRSIENLRLSSRCHWIDSLPAHELSGPYNAADCLLLPSRHENFGNVVVEALGCGCAVLASENVGAGEMLENCRGFHRKKRCAKDWAEGISTILKQKRPGESSSKWIRERFSQEAVALKAKEVLSKVLVNSRAK